MLLNTGKQLFQKLRPKGWGSLMFSTKKEPYWAASFPDWPAPFEDMPTVPEEYDHSRFPEVAEGWFKKYGYVVKQHTPYGEYIVHSFHPEDFARVYGCYDRFPVRRSHQIIAQYRRERKDLYDKVGVIAGQGEDWGHLRWCATRTIHDQGTENPLTNEAANDAMEAIKNHLDEKGEIDLQPWLHRWAFESFGVVTFNRRLGALSKDIELADKMIAAGALTDRIIAQTTMDPVTNYEERYKQLSEAQDFFCGVLRKKIDQYLLTTILETEKNGIVQNLFKRKEFSFKDIVTVITDLFHQSIQTVPLTVLMAMYNLALCSDVQNKTREEVTQVMPNKDAPYTTDRTFSNWIMRIKEETVRLYPPVLGTSRVIEYDMIIGGYEVPANTNVILHSQVVNRQEEFIDDALKFDPSIGNDRTKYRKAQAFGGGARMCVGMAFAGYHLEMMIAKMIRNFEISYNGGDFKMITSLHNKPEKPLIFTLKPVDK